MAASPGSETEAVGRSDTVHTGWVSWFIAQERLLHLVGEYKL